MSEGLVIHVDLDKKCRRCGKGGATQSGVCMDCIAKAVKRGEFNHIFKKAKQQSHTVEVAWNRKR